MTSALVNLNPPWWRRRYAKQGGTRREAANPASLQSPQQPPNPVQRQQRPLNPTDRLVKCRGTRRRTLRLVPPSLSRRTRRVSPGRLSTSSEAARQMADLQTSVRRHETLKLSDLGVVEDVRSKMRTSSRNSVHLDGPHSQPCRLAACCLSVRSTIGGTAPTTRCS
jgi:hypothetical protein